MRVLIPALILLTVAASCDGGSSSRSTPTQSATAARGPAATSAPTTQAIVPFTPVEEVLTPPPDIDTSGWITYRDDTHGFEMRYPPDGQVRRDTVPSAPGADGVGTEIDLPFTRGTTLEAKYIFIKVGDVTQAGCLPAELISLGKPGATPDVTRVHTAAAAFWRTHALGGGMMHGVFATIYMTVMGSTCVTVDAVLYGLSSGAPVDTPPRPPDDTKEIATFTAIVSTFRWLN